MTLLCIYSMYDLKPDIYYISLFFCCWTFIQWHTHTQIPKLPKIKSVIWDFFYTQDTSWGFADEYFFPVVSAGQKQENSSTQTHSSVSENTTEHTDTLQVLHSWDLLFSKSHSLVKKKLKINESIKSTLLTLSDLYYWYVTNDVTALNSKT